jgi:hypothetical protein
MADAPRVAGAAENARIALLTGSGSGASSGGASAPAYGPGSAEQARIDKLTGAGGPVDYNALAQQQLQLRQTANAPFVAQLQGQAPEIASRYAAQESQLNAEKDPLIARYQTLLDQISQKNAADATAAKTNVYRSFGARGVFGGALDTAVNQAVNPINQFYTGQATTTTQDRESQLRQLSNSIANLTGQQTDEQRLLAQKIAELQSGNNNQALTDALNLYGQNQQSAYQQEQLKLQQSADARAGQLQSYNLSQAQLTDPLQLAQLQYAVSQLGKSNGYNSLSFPSNNSNPAPSTTQNTQSTFQPDTNSNNLMTDYSFLGPDTSLFGNQSNNLGNNLNVDFSSLQGLRK